MTNALTTINPVNEIAQAVATEIARQANHSGATSDAQMIDLFVSTRKAESTRQSYARSIDTFMTFVAKPLSEIHVMDFNEFKLMIDEKYTSAATRRNKMMPIKSFLTYANKVGYLRFNVGAAVEIDSVAQTVHDKVISEANIIRLMDALDNDTHKLMVSVLYASGGRVTEFINLRWVDVLWDDNKIVFTVTKTGKPREVALVPAVMAMLLSYYEASEHKNGYIFMSKRKGIYSQYTRAAINNFLNPLGKKLGFKITPHMFRHSSITHDLNNGTAPQIVRDRAGHSSLQVTSLYAHSDNNTPFDSKVFG